MMLNLMNKIRNITNKFNAWVKEIKTKIYRID